MSIIADLHIHGKFSQATSKDLVVNNLEKYARMKGVDLLGTGDFTHPKWIVELKNNLEDDGSGVFKTKTGFPFLLSTELSLIYTQGGRGRRIHNVVLAPDLGTVGQITEYLLSKGRVDYDGRPIFKIPCPEFVESLRGINDKIEVIPAHIWTPWFSMFGSKSGFDTVEECFGDQTKHINALETGLSSDPAMNWRLSQLDGYNLVSFSDLHSFWPWRIGREATLFDCSLTYDNILKALRTGEGLDSTIEVDPAYGKYHYDGHRNCNFSCGPEQTKKLKGICPKCGKELVIGVDYRVEELADREMGFVPSKAKPFKSLMPLSEMLSLILGKGLSTQTVWKEYNKIVSDRSEYDVLLNVPGEDLLKVTSSEIVDVILKNRQGKIKVKPGYDGEYGVPIFDDSEVEEAKIDYSTKQKGLDDFC